MCIPKAARLWSSVGHRPLQGQWSAIEKGQPGPASDSPVQLAYVQEAKKDFDRVIIKETITLHIAVTADTYLDNTHTQQHPDLLAQALHCAVFATLHGMQYALHSICAVKPLCHLSSCTSPASMGFDAACMS